MEYYMEKIKHIYGDISMNTDGEFACYSVRVYDKDNNLLDQYTGIFEKESWKLECFQTHECELMVDILIMEAMPEGSEFTIYTDHEVLPDIWNKKEKGKSLGKLIKSQTVRDRFYDAYNRVKSTCVKVDSIHIGDIWDGRKCISHKLLWHEVSMEQALHLDCDRDCKQVMSDLKKMNKFFNVLACINKGE